MTTRDTVQLALRNLRQARLRTTLTAGGVAIGIASLTGMVSLGVGLQDQLVGRLTQSGLFDRVTVLPGGRNQFGAFGSGRGRGNGGFGGRGGFAVPGGPADGPQVSLDDAAIAAIAAVPDVKEVYPAIRVPLQVSYGEASQVTAAAGIPMSEEHAGSFQTLAFGTFFPNDSDMTCMLSLDAATSLSKDAPGSLIGRDLTVSYAASGAGSGESAQGSSGEAMQIQRVTTPCRVVGIVARAEAPGMSGGGVSDVMLPLGRARAIDATLVRGPQAILNTAGRARTYASLVVKVRRTSATQDVEDAIKGLGYSAFSLSDALQGAKRAFLVLDIALSLIGSIALAVSSLGITNTMVMSILERTREIGVMKAIGASDADVRRIFLVEASAIGAIGGACGVVLGWAVGRAINFAANVYIQSQGGPTGNLFSLPLWLIAGAIAFSWAISLAAGLYPAARASRLNPIQALRHD